MFSDFEDQDDERTERMRRHLAGEKPGVSSRLRSIPMAIGIALLFTTLALLWEMVDGVMGVGE